MELLDNTVDNDADDCREGRGEEGRGGGKVWTGKGKPQRGRPERKK